MRLSSLFVIAAILASLSSSFSQETSSATNPPPRRAAPTPPLVSPDPRPDGSVTFRFKAPHATEVKVAGQFGPETALSKDTQGVWSVTVPSVPAGVHEYHFVVDGLNVIDPNNSELKPQR